MCSRIFSGVAVQILVKGQKNFISPHLETVGLVWSNQWVSSWFRYNDFFNHHKTLKFHTMMVEIGVLLSQKSEDAHLNAIAVNTS